MRKQRQLASRMGLALAVTALVGASAFADSRPSNETRGRRDERGVIRRDGGAARSTASRGDDSSNGSRERSATIERRAEPRSADRSDARVEVRGDRVDRGALRPEDRSFDRRDEVQRGDRSRGTVQRGDTRTRDTAQRGETRGRDTVQQRGDTRGRGGYDNRDGNRSTRDGSWRGDSRHRGSSPSYGSSRSHRQPYYSRGRVSRVHRYGSGYRIWIHGAPYPFFVPLAYYRADRFRVGLSISLGGYYNPGGYYDYYDGRSDGVLRGIVESVDYRRDSFVIRNDATGSFVTILERDRRLEVRPGDYVEISGEWSRAGVFQAWDLDFLDDGYRR